MAGKMITVIDYGAGNLDSVTRALTRLGAAVTLTSDPEQVRRADRLLLPGVGAFAAAMAALQKDGLDEAIRQRVGSGRPLLGVCLGMQLLAESGEEGDLTTAGLGLIPGQVLRLHGQVKVPHVGWNQVQPPADRGPLFAGLPERPWFYFVHSYYLKPAASATGMAMTEHGQLFPAAIWQAPSFGVQFHPEKSGQVGQQLLQNFLDWRG